jgi:hypothetical protein
MRTLMKLDQPSQIRLLIQHAQQGSILELLLAPECKVRELLEKGTEISNSSSSSSNALSGEPALQLQRQLLLSALKADGADALLVLLDKAPLCDGVLRSGTRVYVSQAVLNDLKPEHMKRLLELGMPVDSQVRGGYGWELK